MDLNKIGRFIFKLRTEKGMSQSNLADKIPITRQAVSRWEQGKSIPDSQTLVILSEIFDVSIDELLAGEREPEENNDTVTLNLLDEYHSKKKQNQKIIFTSIFTISTILILFLGYYFINSYNTIKVYKIRGENKIFQTYNGIIISTRKKAYIRLGQIVNENENIEINSVKLYFTDKNKNKRLLYEDNKTDILIISEYGYNENFNAKDMKNIIKNLYLEINYNNGTETTKLSVEKDFSNSLPSPNKRDDLIKDENLNKKASSFYNLIESNMKEKGQKIDDGYSLEIEDNNDKIKFILMHQELLLEVSNQDEIEIWNCYFKNKILFIYTKYKDEEEVEKYHITYNEDEETKKEKELYNKIKKYIDKYLNNSTSN